MRGFSPYDKPIGDIISYVSPFLFVAILSWGWVCDSKGVPLESDSSICDYLLSVDKITIIDYNQIVLENSQR